MPKRKQVVTVRQARTTIRVIRLLCDPCHSSDYEPECASCQARRVVDTIEAMLADGDLPISV
jgi:hypothetical protein